MTSNIDPIIREGGAEAIETIVSIMDAAFDQAYGEAWNRVQCLGILDLPGVWLSLAQNDEETIGFALTRITIDEAELLLIAVQPSARRRGIATHLMNHVLSISKERGASRIHLEVREGNEALSLYEKMGFTIAGRRSSYYRGQFGRSFDALTLIRTLYRQK